MTEGAFFQDIALVMAVAGLVAALFSRMRWPKVLGYIGAGVLLNGHTWGGSLFADPGSISTIA
ncbi:MAG: cation/H(+) antiporter, partial [Kiritimatiellae bacterium]|nr:cation/H(+) antiporter [Kiritimatiellia bacterium]